MQTAESITITKEEIIQNAYKAMENVMAYLAIGDKRMASRSMGEAAVWEEMLLDLMVDDEEWQNEHYRTMVDIVWSENI